MDNSMSPENLYPNTARFYDLRPEMRDHPDLDFYRARAGEARGAVLELACGTGRVTIPLAEAGHEVWGIDLSEAMLAVFEEKRSRLPEDLRNRLHVQLADMSDFALGRKFSLIIIPVRSFIILPTRERQLACLRCVREHLEPGGRFIPTAMWFPAMENEPVRMERAERPVGDILDPETGRRIRRAAVGHGIDEGREFFRSEMVFYIEEPDGSVVRISDWLSQAVLTPRGMRELLRSTGFEIVEEMSDYKGSPIPENPGRPVELIFVCKAG